MATKFKTIKEYLYPDADQKQKIFVIPNYQRGYKWSVRLSEEQTSVEYLLTDLLSAFKSDREQQFFLQGVTVVEENEKIILIDGQQRTTTLYLLLRCLDVKNIQNITIDYSIREQSRDFLNKLKDTYFDYNEVDSENENQDIYYLKQAIEQIKKLLLEELDKEQFTEFILNKISLLYIVVERDKAVRTFTMMNGQKARMLDEELVKAEMLHIISQPTELHEISSLWTIEDTFSIIKEVAAIEWETNALRSKYAREWDKWLYWWNREDVKIYFNVRKPMGLLLEYFYKKKTNSKVFSFRNFKNILPDNEVKSAKDVFKGLRDLQKDFEDVYNNALSYNYLKCALIGSDGSADDRFNIIMYFISNKRNYEELKSYAKWRLLGATHIEITEEFTNDPTVEGGKIKNEDKRRERAQKMVDNLSKSDVYNDDNSKTVLFRQLLRLNVEEYNKLNNAKGIKFDFSIWNNKSLEHILPKSYFYHIEETEDGQKKYIRGDGMEIKECDIHNLFNSKAKEVFTDSSKYSEHCIGNLVLLYGRNNSTFGAMKFEAKKKCFFNNEISFESRSLLHTISYFANSKWEPADIEMSAKKIIEILKSDYNLK